MSDFSGIIHAATVNGIIVVDFVGSVSLDETNAEQFGEELFGLVDGGPSNILLNFSKVDYISSGPMGKLMGLYKSVASNNGKIKLCCIQPRIRKIIKITQFDRLFEIFDGQEEALSCF